MVCLERFLGRCKGCAPDYDLNHHPNNYDCPYYHEIAVAIVTVEPEEKLRKIKNDMD